MAKLTVNTEGNWTLYATTLPARAVPLGTVTRETGETGALARLETGAYVQLNAGAVRTLDGRHVTAALGLAGRPAELTKAKRINVYLDAKSLATAATLGQGNVSAGIRHALKKENSDEAGVDTASARSALVDGLELDLQGREFPVSTVFQKQLDELDIQEILVRPGPRALVIEGCQPDVVFTHEAWPHIDEDFKGTLLVTLTLSAGRHSLGCTSRPDEIRFKQGQVWIIDPLELHWLRPDTLASSPWIALQWVVDTDKVERFMVAFRAQLKAWNQPDFVLPTLE